MITFKRAQSIVLWLHIPMWIVVSIVVIIMGAYHAGRNNAEAKQIVFETQAVILPVMTLKQLTEIRVKNL